MAKQKTFRFFIAGIIQGSRKDRSVHDQTYRRVIRQSLTREFPGSQIYCPAGNHPGSPSYPDDRAREVFHHHIEMIKKAHVLVVFLPEASLGSAIEMWEAAHRGVMIVSITPMHTNWVVRILSDEYCRDLEAFAKLVESGKLKNRLMKRFGHAKHGEAGETG